MSQSQIQDISLSINREWIEMYLCTRYDFKIEISNEDGTKCSFYPCLTYKGKWEDETTYLCRSINSVYNKKEMREIGTKILQEFHILGEEYFLTEEMVERMKNIGGLLFSGIVR